MTPTSEFLHKAERVINHTLETLRPQLLEAQGTIAHRLKGDRTVVTKMDLLVEDRLRQSLAAFDKRIGFGGEESGVDLTQPTFWLVDPIDGTEPFIRGMPFATNMVALIHQGEPILGIIYNFMLGDYYLAIKGEGATRNGHTIHVSNRGMDRAWVTIGAAPEEPGVEGLYDKISTMVCAVRRYGASGFEYTQIASGAIEARITYRGHGAAWDFAPGALLVQEAGGRAANIRTASYDFRDLNHVVANPATFEELMAVMNTVGVDQ